MKLSDITIVLCRPSESGNIGAVCRVMKNMGFSELRLVSPVINDETALLSRAVHAEDIWKKTLFFDNLKDAVSDCVLAIGTSRRRGRKRKNSTMTPEELARYLAEWNGGSDRAGKTALVFGNERTGLETDELKLCNLSSHIDAEQVFPSLNLSHAVQIYAYELRGAFLKNKNAVKGRWEALNRAETEKLVKKISANLEKIGFYRHPGREEQETFLRDLISRAGLTTDEARYLGDILSKTMRLSAAAFQNL